MENPLAVKSFQLTTSHRGRQAEKEIEDIHQNFNSLPHTEVDHQELSVIALYNHFNSLPHTEVDCTKGVITPEQYISTHYLTQR